MKNAVPGFPLAGTDNLIREFGRDPISIAQASGIPVALFEDASTPIEVGNAVRYVELAAQVCGCETFGLRLAEGRDLSMLGPVWVLMQDASTVREMLRDLERHMFLHTAAITVTLQPTAEGLALSYAHAADAGVDDRQAVEWGVAMIVQELARRLETRWHPSAVQFRHRPPRDLRLHRRIFGPDVFFNQETSGFTVQRDVLDRPLSNSHRGHTLVALLMNQQSSVKDSCATRVESIVTALMPYTVPTREVVARHMMLSPRTLQRYLVASGTNFDAIRDKVRANLAAKYLRQSSLSVTQIAELLGYSQTSAFCRSFVRWYGVSALAFRRTDS